MQRIRTEQNTVVRGSVLHIVPLALHYIVQHCTTLHSAVRCDAVTLSCPAIAEPNQPCPGQVWVCLGGGRGVTPTNFICLKNDKPLSRTGEIRE